MSTPRPPLELPLPLLVVNLVGMLMMGGGAAGLAVPEALPGLARPAVAWSLLGAGLLLDLGSAVGIALTAARARRDASAR